MADGKIRWGIISTANIGRNALVPAFKAASNAELVAVASRDGAKAQEFADAVGVPTAHNSYEALIDDPNIDAIYNPLPNHLHGEWSIRALEAGKHVLCEKPMASNADEAQRMVDVAHANNRWLSEAFMYRFHPQTVKVKELVDSGALGELQFIDSAFSFYIRSEDNIRLYGDMEGGALMDIGCYCVSIMRLLTGEEPSQVEAYGHINDRGADEQAAGVLKFPSGVLGTFNCSMRTSFVNRYEVRGTLGRVVVEPSFTPARDRDTTVQFWHGKRGEEAYEEFHFDAVDQYKLMVEDFDDAILNNRPPRFAPEDGVAAMRLLDALRESVRRNQ